jgi:hypothetical protein
MDIKSLNISDFGTPAVRRWALNVISRSITEGLVKAGSLESVEAAIREPDLVYPSDGPSIIAKFCTIYSGLESSGKLGDLTIERQGFVNSAARFSNTATGFFAMKGAGVSGLESKRANSRPDGAKNLKRDIQKAVKKREMLGFQPHLIELGEVYQEERLRGLVSRKEKLDQLAEMANELDVDPIYNNAVRLAEINLKSGNPSEAVRAINSLGLPPTYRGAVMLEASYRHRFGGDNPTFLNKIRPAIIQTLLMDKIVTGDELGLLKDAVPIEGRLKHYIDVARGKGRAIHLEFGGGRAPGGLMTAYEKPDAISISIDPTAQSIDHDRLYFVPTPNFVFMRGRAEEAALLAADGPYADGVLLVAPQPFNLNSLLLSALLTVKPGGQIDIYSMDGIHLDMLEDFEIEYSSQDLTWDVDYNHPSTNIDHGARVTHVRFTVPDFLQGLYGYVVPGSEIRSNSFAGFLNPEISGETGNSMLEDDANGNPLGDMSPESLTSAPGNVSAVPAISITAGTAAVTPIPKK